MSEEQPQPPAASHQGQRAPPAPRPAPGPPPPRRAACLRITVLQRLGAEGGHGPREMLRAMGAPTEPWMAASGPRRSGNLLLQKGFIPLPPDGGASHPCGPKETWPSSKRAHLPHHRQMQAGKGWNSITGIREAWPGPVFICLGRPPEIP